MGFGHRLCHRPGCQLGGRSLSLGTIIDYFTQNPCACSGWISKLSSSRLSTGEPRAVYHEDLRCRGVLGAVSEAGDRPFTSFSRRPT